MDGWGLRAFAVAGPSCWNELPVELRDLTVSPTIFAKHLKTHLFRVVFFLIKHALLSLCNILYGALSSAIIIIILTIILLGVRTVLAQRLDEPLIRQILEF